MEWNDDTITRLRVLWDEGLSTAEIGRRLGVSKNAVVGKAHRLSLPARPSPIRRDGARMPRAMVPRRLIGPTLPPFATALPATIAPATPHLHAMVAGETNLAPPAAAAEAHSQPHAEAAPPAEPAVRVVRPVPVPAGGTSGSVPAATRFSSRMSACCWPLGDPGTPNFRFCDAAALPAKPYCGEHAQLAYVKVRDRREEAA